LHSSSTEAQGGEDEEDVAGDSDASLTMFVMLLMLQGDVGRCWSLKVCKLENRLVNVASVVVK
jgi:hypothetical protein